ncbi:hypothetical protein HPB52_014848 [Rhipicephalus sanguineus]|uniref:Uncharacterized protein n=1 Tax=Rhipicephalus sanguineus TaxID=34632 RepID=A0A9D4SU42_RHISA|nr:hypothetical protein HPB52_014848 [Rhipicephalus sanguineus]
MRPAHLYHHFQGKTVADMNQRANGACLPVPAGTWLCPCGDVTVHDSHKQSKLHRHRTGNTPLLSRDPSGERPNEAASAMLARAAQETDFTQWLLTKATGHAAGVGQHEWEQCLRPSLTIPDCVSHPDRQPCSMYSHGSSAVTQP